MRGQTALLILIPALTAQAATEEAARDVLASRCLACHAQIASGGLRLDSREAVCRGGESGAAIVAGDAAKSRRYQAVSRTVPGVKPMPPEVSLTREEVAALKRWIDEGAPWSASGDHWSFRPLARNQKGQTID